MDLIVMLLLIGVVAALIAGPLVRARPPAQRAAPPPRPDRAKNAALAAIREIEFDYATGKLSAEDYTDLRARYETKAVEAMERQTARGAPPRTDRIEAEIRAARARKVPVYCAACGAALPPAARFCPACGAAAAEVRR